MAKPAREPARERSHGGHDSEGEPRLALYASVHSRSGRPRFVGPAPRLSLWQRIKARLFG
jgi:hypothetical protein